MRKPHHNSLVTECSIQGAIRLRAAFTRRSLAYALAGVACFEVVEGCTQLLCDRVCQDPPSGCKHISIEQIVTADKHFWVKVSERTRSKIHTVVDGVKAVDAATKELSHHPEVQFHMLPLPTYTKASGSLSPDNSRSAPYHQSHGDRDKSKSKGKGKEKGGKGKKEVPQACSIKFGDNKKPICMKLNVGACGANIKPGKRCLHGYHVWKDNCNKPCAFHECTHKV